MDNIVHAEQIAFTFPQNGRGLQATSLTVAAGEVVHISGSSGSGKSTLARCLTGIIPHLYKGGLSGCVTVAGKHTDNTPVSLHIWPKSANFAQP